MEKEKRKAGLQPDGSWVLTGDEEQPYKIPEKSKEASKPDDKEDDM